MPISIIHPGVCPTRAPVGQWAACEDHSTLVLSCVSSGAVDVPSAILVQNHASSFVAWSDVFDVHATPCDAWWLRNACAHDASELCVPDVEQLRSMGSRLARAAQLAASGSKWGLLKAVLLSWDTVPASAQNWVRQQIALEACGLLILPAAAQGLSGALKGAWEQLPGKEQQLWCQLQQARVAHSRPGMRPSALLCHYTVDRLGVVGLLKCATGMEEAGALLVEPFIETGQESVAVMMLDTFLHRDMAASYTYLLLCCREYGHDHARTREALADACETDPDGWVPRLLAGLAYPSVNKGPGVMLGKKEEATAYVATYGNIWSTAEELRATYTSHLTWVLQQRGISVPPKAAQAELLALRYMDSGLLGLAYAKAHALTYHEAEGGDFAQHAQQVGVAHYVRACLVVVGCLFQITYNLPPLDVAPQLWTPVAELLGVPDTQRDPQALRTYLSAVFEHHYKSAACLLMAKTSLGDGFLQPAEPESMRVFLTTTQPIACRLYWQLGYLAQAGSIPASVAMQRGHLKALHDQAAARAGGDPNNRQLQAVLEQMKLGGDIGAWNAVAAFLGEQSQAAVRNRMSAATAAAPAGSRLLSSAEADALQFFSTHELVSYRPDPLFDSFPGWVDQLVSQVVGRPVKLAIDVHPSEPAAGRASGQLDVFLVEADGSKVPFSWPARFSGATAARGGSSAGTTTSSSNRGSGSTASAGAAAAPKKGFSFRAALAGSSSSAAGASQAPGSSSSRGMGNSSTHGSTPSTSSSSGGGSGTGSVHQRLQEAAHEFGLKVAAVTSLNGKNLEEVQEAMYKHMTLVEEQEEPGGDDERRQGRPAGAGAGRPNRQTAAAAASGRNGTRAAAQGTSTVPAAETQGASHAAGSSGSSSRSQPSQQAGVSHGSHQSAEPGQGPPAAPGRAGSTAAAAAAAAAAAGSSTAPPGTRKPPKPCAMCGELFPRLQLCSRCKKVGYCSKEHQLEHWKLVHKAECQGQQ